MTLRPPHLLLPLALTAALCGCRVVREARQIQEQGATLPGERTSSAAEAGLTAGEACSLTGLVRIALSSHPALLQARQSVEAARLQCRLIRSGRLPQLSASGGYTRATQNVSGRPTSSAMRGTWNSSLGLDLLLFDFGKLDAQERQALESLVAAEEQLRASEIDVAYAVRTAFFELHRSAELHRVANESERLYAQHLTEARAMVEVGTRRQYDATKAEVDWGNAVLDVITASNAYVTARAQLARDLGLAEYPDFSLREETLPAPADTDAASLLARARENAPALAVLRARERAASYAVDEAVAALYPDVTLSSDLTLGGRDLPLTPNFSWTMRLVQTLFDGNRRADRIRTSLTELRSARARVADAEQALFLSLVSAAAQYQSATKRLDTALLVARQAAENRDLVNEQYRVGLSSSIERTDAQVAVTRAQADVVRARYDAHAAQALLARLTGEAAAPDADGGPIATDAPQGQP